MGTSSARANSIKVQHERYKFECERERRTVNVNIMKIKLKCRSPRTDKSPRVRKTLTRITCNARGSKGQTRTRPDRHEREHARELERENVALGFRTKLHR